MKLYEFVFPKELNNNEESETWIIQAHTMDREIASSIVRSICKPEEFTSVQFTVYEVTYSHCGSDTKSGNYYTIYIPDDDGIQQSKKLFSMRALGIEDMLEILFDAKDQAIVQMDDLLISLKANHTTILKAIRLYRKQQSEPKPEQN